MTPRPTRPTPPGRWKILWIMARLGLRRIRNQYGAGFAQFSRLSKKKKNAWGAAPVRQGELGRSGKKPFGKILLTALFALFLGYYAFMASGKLAAWSDQQSIARSGLIPLDDLNYQLLEFAITDGDLDSYFARRSIKKELASAGFSVEEATAAARETGMAAFASGPSDRLRLRPEQSESLSLYRKSMGLVIGIGGLGWLLMGLGMANKDLGRLESSFAWLFHFPIQNRDLLMARIGEFAFASVISWVAFSCFIAAGAIGMGLASLPALLWGAGSGALIIICASAIRLLIEQLARRRGNFQHLKNVQAFCSFFGILLFYVALAAVFAMSVPRWFGKLVDVLPDFSFLPPFGLPLLVADGRLDWRARIIVCFILVGGTLLLCRVVQSIATFLLRGGVSAGAVSRISKARSKIGEARALASRRPVLRKELRRISRDRAFLFQIVGLPLVLIAYQFLIFGETSVTESSFRSGAMVAFGLATYTMLLGCMGILAHEKPGLQFLASLPGGLERACREKIGFWMIVGGFFGVVALIAVVGIYGWPKDPFHLVALAAGIVIYAIVAGSIGILGSRPWEEEKNRQVRQSSVYLFFLLAGLYIGTFLTPTIWGRLSMMILYVFMGIAFWQRARDVLPYAFDQHALPPKRIHLSDGLVGMLLFLNLQSVIYLIGGIYIEEELKLDDGTLPPNADILFTIAFVGAAILTGLGMLAYYGFRKVPNWTHLVGLRIRSDASPSKTTKVLAISITASILAALAWLSAIHQIPLLSRMVEEATSAGRHIDAKGPWLLFLLVVAAPVFEEFLFRGVLFRGLERSMRPLLAIILSAALFATVHPMLSFPPVFVVGLCTAWVFRTTGVLWAPILVHAVYNAAVYGLL